MSAANDNPVAAFPQVPGFTFERIRRRPRRPPRHLPVGSGLLDLQFLQRLRRLFQLALPEVLTDDRRLLQKFVEVKLENLAKAHPYFDSLNEQQKVLFPLIQTHLGCGVRLARVQVTTVG